MSVTFSRITEGSKIYRTIMQNGVRWFGRNITNYPGRWTVNGYEIDYPAVDGETFLVVNPTGYVAFANANANESQRALAEVQSPFAFIGTSAYLQNELSGDDEIRGIIEQVQRRIYRNEFTHQFPGDGAGRYKTIKHR